jgi:predicted nucleic acid-binding protein
MIPNSVVVDSNLIFSALISNASRIRDILLENNMNFYSPNFLITEIYKHKDKIVKNSHLVDSEFYLYLNGLIERIKFVPIDYISIESRQKAYDLCKSIDVKDTPFVALAVDLKIPLWTGDKKLREGLTKNGFINFFNP